MKLDLRALQREYEFDLVGAKRTSRRRAEELIASPNLSSVEALALFDERVPELAKVCGNVEQDLRLVFRALGEHDLYICQCLDQVPYELEGTGWSMVGRDVARAVDSGAVFLYVFSGAQLASRITHAD